LIHPPRAIQFALSHAFGRLRRIAVLTRFARHGKTGTGQIDRYPFREIISKSGAILEPQKYLPEKELSEAKLELP